MRVFIRVVPVRVIIRIRWRRGVWRSFAWLLAVAGICAVAVSAWILGADRFMSNAPKVRQLDPLAGVTMQQPDLVLEEATIYGGNEHRKVAGVLVNKSGRMYTNVSLTFNLTRGVDNVGAVYATVSRIASHGAARFETNEFAEAEVLPILREMTIGSP